jgi:RNA polymerase sigma-70 factor, ECF subfamily
MRITYRHEAWIPGGARGAAGRGGDDAKGREFLKRFLPAERRIFGYILTLVPDRADADDLLQETSLAMWEQFDPGDPPRDMLAWGCRIAYFQVQHHRRAWRRRMQFSDRLVRRLAESAREQSRSLRLEERGEFLADCMAKLPPRDRELLAERLKDGATTQSTAERLGRTADVVYKAMARIRRLLADCIERRLRAEGCT